MARAARTLLALAIAAVAVPATPSSAACTSDYPVEDRRVASHFCDGLHPGTLLTVPSKKYGTLDCTAGFFFTDQFGNRYTSVPGSCHLDYTCLEDAVVEVLPPPLDELVGGILPCIMPGESELEPVYRSNAPVVKDADGDRVGVIVWAVNKNGLDFALVRIDPKVKVSPAIPMYGGPTRLTAAATGDDAYAYSGYRGGVLPNAQWGVINGQTWHTGLPFVLGGSPGAPVVRADAAGIGYYSGRGSLAWGMEVLPYGPAIERTASRLRLSLRLMTAKAA